MYLCSSSHHYNVFTCYICYIFTYFVLHKLSLSIMKLTNMCLSWLFTITKYYTYTCCRAGMNADFLYSKIWPSKQTNVWMFVTWAFSDSHFLHVHFDPLRLRDTGRMCVRRRAHNRLKMCCEQLARTALWYVNFLVWFRSSQARFHSDLGNKVISGTFSRDWRELFSISVMVSKIFRFKHVGLRFWKWDRGRFLTFFDNQNEYLKKALFSPSAMFIWWVYYKNRSYRSVRWKFEQYMVLSLRSRKVWPHPFFVALTYSIDSWKTQHY